MGGTGDPPVPVGDPPTGTSEEPRRSTRTQPARFAFRPRSKFRVQCFHNFRYVPLYAPHLEPTPHPPPILTSKRLRLSAQGCPDSERDCLGSIPKFPSTLKELSRSIQRAAAFRFTTKELLPIYFLFFLVPSLLAQPQPGTVLWSYLRQ